MARWTKERGFSFQETTDHQAGVRRLRQDLTEQRILLKKLALEMVELANRASWIAGGDALAPPVGEPGYCVHCGIYGGAGCGEDRDDGAECPDQFRNPRKCEIAPERCCDPCTLDSGPRGQGGPRSQGIRCQDPCPLLALTPHGEADGD